MPNLPRKISYIFKEIIAMLVEPIIGYSRVVSLTKISLLAIAFALIAGLIILPFSNKVNKNFRLTFTNVEKKENSDLPQMSNPHLQGVDGSNHTYNITAQSAVQDKKDGVTLKKLNADINLNDGWVSITAEDGYYDHSQNTMDLYGNINIFNQDGYEFTTEQAYADMKKNIIYGNVPVKGQGPMGKLSADRFVVENKGQSIVLTGHVRLFFFAHMKK